MARRRFKRVLVIADTHCGHRVGLTPDQYWQPFTDLPQTDKYARTQRTMWNEFRRMVDSIRPIDILICNGDMIEGKGERSGGTELLRADRNEQIDMAVAVVEEIDPTSIVVCYGTPAHVGDKEDFEQTFADKVGAVQIRSHGFWSVHGVNFDVKHKIGSSSIPHGRLTALAREILWNRQWAGRGEAPRADILIRSHVHYYEQITHDNCLGVITPCLQGWGSKYGARQCSGVIDFGMVYFDVYEDGTYTWNVKKLTGQVQQEVAVAL